MSFQQLYDAADKAGREAYDTCVPRPVIFGQAADLFSNAMVPGTERLETEGLCGFAWVEVRPTRSPFGKWLRDHGYGRHDDYRHCVTVWVGGPSQSIARKEAYAHAFAKVLQADGIDAFSCSRLD